MMIFSTETDYGNDTAEDILILLFWKKKSFFFRIKIVYQLCSTTRVLTYVEGC